MARPATKDPKFAHRYGFGAGALHAALVLGAGGLAGCQAGGLSVDESPLVIDHLREPPDDSSAVGASDPDSGAPGLPALATLPDDPFPEEEPGVPLASVDAWLKAHQVKEWPHDRTCWHSVGGSPLKVCDCERALTLATEPPVDLLWCSRYDDGPRASSIPAVTHTVLLVADRGRLGVALDIPTHATSDCEPPFPGLNAEEYQKELRERGMQTMDVILTVDGPDIVVREGIHLADPTRTCAGMSAAATHPSPARDPTPAPCPTADSVNPCGGPADMGIYRSICASAGRWRWTRAGFVHTKPAG